MKIQAKNQCGNLLQNTELHHSVLVCERMLHSEMQPSGKRKDIYTWLGVNLLKIEVHTASLAQSHILQGLQLS
jgi:hypothetical protein